MECPQYSIWLKTLGCLCTTMDMWCDSIVAHQCLLQHYMSCRHPASDVVENLGADFLYGVHSPGDWLWTRLPVEGFFRNKFLSIYIWSIVITELWQRQVARRWKKISNFCSFCGKTTPYGKIFKSLLQKDSSQHRSSCCVQISWNLADRKSVKLCIAYLTKNILPGSPSLGTVRIAPKIYQGQPPRMYSECSIFRPNRFTFGRVIPEWVNTVKVCSKVNPRFGWSLSSSRLMMHKLQHHYNIIHIVS